VMKSANLSRPFDQIELLTGSVTVKLALVESLQGSARQAALREMRGVCRKTLRYARIHRYWLAQALRLNGLACWLDGKPALAHKHWKESVAVADQARFPLERARTLMEVGYRTGEVESLEQAAVIFRENGANVFLSFALDRLAKVRQQQSPDHAL